MKSGQILGYSHSRAKRIADRLDAGWEIKRGLKDNVALSGQTWSCRQLSRRLEQDGAGRRVWTVWAGDTSPGQGQLETRRERPRLMVRIWESLAVVVQIHKP